MLYLTGYDKLDAVTSGFHNGELIIIKSSPGQGKTVLAVGLALNSAIKQKKSTAYFSLEMSSESLYRRMLSSNQLTEDDIKSSPLFIDDTPHLPISKLESQIRKLRAEHQVELVFVDYLGLVDFADGSSSSRAEHIAKIIVALKALAVEIGISIICSHEIPRDKEEEEKAISDAAIESCDVIIHINQGDNNEWDLLVSKRLTIAK